MNIVVLILVGERLPLPEINVVPDARGVLKLDDSSSGKMSSATIEDGSILESAVAVDTPKDLAESDALGQVADGDAAGEDLPRGPG